MPFYPSKNSMDINGQTVTGVADVSIRQFRYNKLEQGAVMEWKTFAVCKVNSSSVILKVTYHRVGSEYIMYLVCLFLLFVLMNMI